MNIGGIQHLSLVDYPGKLSAVLFTVGCQFRCPFCHNPELVTGHPNSVKTQEIFDFLKKRSGQIDGVVISGGEPTIHADLPELILKIRAMGYAVKLDTNGTSPEVLSSLIEARLVDFVAMDIKHTWEKYKLAVGMHEVNIDNIKRSAELLIYSDIDYEFRTTVIKNFHTAEDIVEISSQIRGAKRYAVQEFIPKVTLDPSFHEKSPFDRGTLQNLTPLIINNVKHFEIRQ